ncbi:hypothetical protein LXL04_038143 [Taraxacum kok-saghyz]
MFISRRSWTKTSNFKRRFRFRFRFNPAVIARLLKSSQKHTEYTGNRLHFHFFGDYAVLRRIRTHTAITQFIHAKETESVNGFYDYSLIKNLQDIHQELEFSGDDEVKFSNHGRELVAGSSDDSIYVYDVEANKLSLLIQAHTSDVNNVCFVDEASHLIYSGSDDNVCKVWDRRCFRSKGKPAGILMGHLKGITFLDTRGDGRYLISNGKDQTIKLWDIRKMSSNATRWMDYPLRARDVKHPSDQSVAMYKGHSVLRTLIRC